MSPSLLVNSLGYLLYLRIYNERNLKEKHFKILDYNTHQS